MAKTIDISLDLNLSTPVPERCHVTESDVAATVEEPKTWVDLVVTQIVGEKDLDERYLTDPREFNRAASGPAAGHLHLLHDNTDRTPWLAAQPLSSDPHVARDATAALHNHLMAPESRQSNELRESLGRRTGTHARHGRNHFSRASSPAMAWQRCVREPLQIPRSALPLGP